MSEGFSFLSIDSVIATITIGKKTGRVSTTTGMHESMSSEEPGAHGRHRKTLVLFLKKTLSVFKKSLKAISGIESQSRTATPAAANAFFADSLSRYTRK
jgi:hypothetical protein